MIELKVFTNYYKFATLCKFQLMCLSCQDQRELRATWQGDIGQKLFFTYLLKLKKVKTRDNRTYSFLCLIKKNAQLSNNIIT